jgi:hypothetical protein
MGIEETLIGAVELLEPALDVAPDFGEALGRGYARPPSILRESRGTARAALNSKDWMSFEGW